MDGIEQVEAHLNRLAGSGFSAGVEGNGDHGQHCKELDGDPISENRNPGAVHHPGHQRQQQCLEPEFAPGLAEKDDQKDSKSAVVRIRPFGQSAKGSDDQQLQPVPFGHFQKLNGDVAQQQRDHNALIAPGQPTLQGEVKGDFRKKHADKKTQGILSGIFGMYGSLRQEEAINWECNPADDPQGIPTDKYGTDMIQQHGDAGNQF